jgi:oxygen-dependent protoporphyrinogen oxidase
MKLAIVGGGISGLSAGYFLSDIFDEIFIFESENELGGKIRTLNFKNHLLELGPDSILNSFQVEKFIFDLNLENEIIFPNYSKINVLYNNKILTFEPEIVSLNPISILKSKDISIKSKINLLFEPFKKSVENDESLEEFITRRFGKEIFLKIGQPILANIYNTDGKELSVLSAFENLKMIEKNYKSFLKFALLSKLKRRNMFFSIKSGMDKIVKKLSDELIKRNVKILFGSKVMKISKFNGKIKVFTNFSSYEFDKVILAIPSFICYDILKDFGDICELFLKTKWTSTITSYIITKEHLKLDLGNGFLVSPLENLNIKGCTIYSNKWPQKVSNEFTILRFFLKDRPFKEDEIKDIIISEMDKIFNIKLKNFEIINYRWENSFPQYPINHKENVKMMKEFFKNENIYFIGSSYDGVGISSCINQAFKLRDEINETIKAEGLKNQL